MPAYCVRAYNSAGKLAEGLKLAAAHLSEEETREIYMPLAQQLREEGQLRKAEQIYIGLGEPDEAISMYKVRFLLSLHSNVAHSSANKNQPFYTFISNNLKLFA